jgi:hypothetical protein
MSVDAAILGIGLSHLLQPPLAYLLMRRLALRRALAQSPPLLAQLMQNMVLASVVLPTTLGIVLALHAHEAAAPGAGRTLAWVVSAFWCWRFIRQCQAAAVWRSASDGAALHVLLSAIFLVQGPGLGLLLALS